MAQYTIHEPVYTSIAFRHDSSRELAAAFQGEVQRYTYGRQSNSTVSALQDKITAIENGIATTCFSTGMAAITSVMLSRLKPGDHLISSSFLFGNTNSLLSTLNHFGINVSFVGATRGEEINKVYRPGTKAVFVETIANPCTLVGMVLH